MAVNMDRLGVIAELIRSASNNLGRTAVMKCLYILQNVKNVPLGYKFRLYTYGPFDAAVLEDLQYATSIGVITTTPVHYSRVSGYEMQPGPRLDQILEGAADFLNQYRQDIEWVAKEFGSRTAADLEMISTIIFVDRSARVQRSRISIDAAVDTVRGIKPHLSEDSIRLEAHSLVEQRLLEAIY